MVRLLHFDRAMHEKTVNHGGECASAQRREGAAQNGPPPPLVGFDAEARVSPSADLTTELLRAEKRLVRFLRRLGLSPQDADDALQEVALVALRRRTALSTANTSSFLFGTAYRVAARIMKRKRERGAREYEVDDLTGAAPEGSSPEDTLRRQEALERLSSAIVALPADLSIVLVLHGVCEKSVSEMSATLELPRGTVADRLRRAKLAMASLLVQADQH